MIKNIARIFILLVMSLSILVLAQESQDDSALGKSALEDDSKQPDQQQEQKTSENNPTTDPQDGDITPDEEISEDFSVSLPSDI